MVVFIFPNGINIFNFVTSLECSRLLYLNPFFLAKTCQRTLQTILRSKWKRHWEIFTWQACFYGAEITGWACMGQLHGCGCAPVQAVSVHFCLWAVKCHLENSVVRIEMVIIGNVQAVISHSSLKHWLFFPAAFI